MKSAPEAPLGGNSIESEAARWVLRCDRGLTAVEQDELSAWLAQNPQHGSALAACRWGWDELDRVAGLQTSVGARPDPDLLAPRAASRSIRWGWAGTWGLAGLAAAAAVAVGFWLRSKPIVNPDLPVAAAPAVQPNWAAACERRTLDDGTAVELNRGAEIAVAFSPTARRVELRRGEANFLVARDPARPFAVEAGGVIVRAIGTVFNVRLDPRSVEVVVTEGIVDVAPPRLQPAEAPRVRVEPSQRAIVALANDAVPEVTTLAPQQVQFRLAWQPRLLDFTDAPLTEIVEQFNARNPVQLVIADPELRTMRLSATFRSDNVEGFVRLMESDFALRAEWRSAREVALARAR